MQYFHAPNQNYEDFASGRVLYHKSGLATFPVRLAIEIMGRCLGYLSDKKVTLYDPMCGEAYLLTVLGFWYAEKIDSIIGSDIAEEALDFAGKNLSLLKESGLMRREEELKELFATYQKPTHAEALESLARMKTRLTSVNVELFSKDVLDPDPKEHMDFQADLIFTDVPYGQMVSWKGKVKNPAESMLTNLLPQLAEGGVLAIVTDKQQKVKHDSYQRLEKFGVGKRKVEIYSRIDLHKP